MRIWRKTFAELNESYNADSRIRRFTSRRLGQIFQPSCINKTVRIYDAAKGKINAIPSAELAPGMLEVEVQGVGRVWINSAEM